MTVPGHVNVQQLSDGIASCMRVDEKDVTGLLQSMMMTNPNIAATASQSLMNNLTDHCKKIRHLPVARCKQKMTAAEQQKLRDLYPDLNIDFVDAKDSDAHYFCRAVRQMFFHSVIAKHGRRLRRGYDALYKDVGSNPTYHILQGNENVHCCCPCLNFADSVRKNIADDFVYNPPTSLTNKQSIVYQEHKARNRRVICNDRAEHCYVTAPYLVLVHSSYDMKPEIVATSMRNANAVIGYGIMLFNAYIFIKKKGYMEDAQCTWERYTENKVEMIKFLFKNDTQNAYVHRFADYCSMLVTQVCRSGDHYYAIRHVKWRYDHLFYSVHRINGIPMNEKVFRPIPIPDAEHLYVIDIRHMRQHLQWFKTNTTRARIFVPRSLFDKVFTYAIVLREGVFTLRAIYNVANAYNNRVVVNGANVAVPERFQLDPEELMDFGVAIYTLVYERNYFATKVMLDQKKRIDKHRKVLNGNIVSRLYHRVRTHMKEKIWAEDFQKEFKVHEDDVTACDDSKRTEIQAKEESLKTAMGVVTFKQMPMVLEVESEIYAAVARAFVPQENDDDDDCEEADIEDAITEALITGDVLNLDVQRVCGGALPKVDVQLTEIPVPGDGKCGYYALQRSGATSLTVDQLRDFFARSENPQVSAVGNATEGKDAWVEDICLLEYAKAYNVTIVLVNRRDGPCDLEYDTMRILNDGYPRYYIVYKRDHFDAAIPKSLLSTMPYDVESTEICPTIAKVSNKTETQKSAEAFFKKSKSVVSSAKERFEKLEDMQDAYNNSAAKLLEIVTSMNPFPNGTEKVLDLCAAPGGFTKTMIEKFGSQVTSVTVPEASDSLFSATKNMVIKNPVLRNIRTDNPFDDSKKKLFTSKGSKKSGQSVHVAMKEDLSLRDSFRRCTDCKLVEFSNAKFYNHPMEKLNDRRSEFEQYYLDLPTPKELEIALRDILERKCEMRVTIDAKIESEYNDVVGRFDIPSRITAHATVVDINYEFVCDKMIIALYFNFRGDNKPTGRPTELIDFMNDPYFPDDAKLYEEKITIGESDMNSDAGSFDIFSIYHQKQFKITVKEIDDFNIERFDVVLADGYDAHNAENVEINDLCFTEAMTAVRTIHKHGCFIIKLFDPEQHRTLCLISMLKKIFEKVRVIKPLYSRSTNFEFYAVCNNLLGRVVFPEIIEVKDINVSKNAVKVLKHQMIMSNVKIRELVDNKAMKVLIDPIAVRIINTRVVQMDCPETKKDVERMIADDVVVLKVPECKIVEITSTGSRNFIEKGSVFPKANSIEHAFGYDLTQLEEAVKRSKIGMDLVKQVLDVEELLKWSIIKTIKDKDDSLIIDSIVFSRCQPTVPLNDAAKINGSIVTSNDDIKNEIRTCADQISTSEQIDNEKSDEDDGETMHSVIEKEIKKIKEPDWLKYMTDLPTNRDILDKYNSKFLPIEYLERKLMNATYLHEVVADYGVARIADHIIKSVSKKARTKYWNLVKEEYENYEDTDKFGNKIYKAKRAVTKRLARHSNSVWEDKKATLTARFFCVVHASDAKLVRKVFSLHVGCLKRYATDVEQNKSRANDELIEFVQSKLKGKKVDESDDEDTSTIAPRVHEVPSAPAPDQDDTEKQSAPSNSNSADTFEEYVKKNPTKSWCNFEQGPNGAKAEWNMTGSQMHEYRKHKPTEWSDPKFYNTCFKYPYIDDNTKLVIVTTRYDKTLEVNVLQEAMIGYGPVMSNLVPKKDVMVAGVKIKYNEFNARKLAEVMKELSFEFGRTWNGTEEQDDGFYDSSLVKYYDVVTKNDQVRTGHTYWFRDPYGLQTCKMMHDYDVDVTLHGYWISEKAQSVHEDSTYLLNSPCEVKAHCVSKCGAMSNGIAAEFANTFKTLKGEFLKNDPELGDCIAVTYNVDGKKYVIANLVTKTTIGSNVVQRDLMTALVALNTFLKNNGYMEVGMCKIATGNDGFKWNEVKYLIENTIDPMIKVRVHEPRSILRPKCNFPSTEEQPVVTSRSGLTDFFKKVDPNEAIVDQTRKQTFPTEQSKSSKGEIRDFLEKKSSVSRVIKVADKDIDVNEKLHENCDCGAGPCLRNSVELSSPEEIREATKFTDAVVVSDKMSEKNIKKISEAKPGLTVKIQTKVKYGNNANVTKSIDKKMCVVAFTSPSQRKALHRCVTDEQMKQIMTLLKGTGNQMIYVKSPREMILIDHNIDPGKLAELFYPFVCTNNILEVQVVKTSEVEQLVSVIVNNVWTSYSVTVVETSADATVVKRTGVIKTKIYADQLTYRDYKHEPYNMQQLIDEYKEFLRQELKNVVNKCIEYVINVQSYGGKYQYIAEVEGKYKAINLKIMTEQTPESEWENLKHMVVPELNRLITPFEFKNLKTKPDQYKIVTCDSLEKATNAEVIDIINSFGNAEIGAKIDVIQAGPGCGKSTNIVERFNFDRGDIVLSATREAANDLQEKISRKHDIDKTLLESRVRTMNSYVMRPRQCTHIFIDEAFMQHPGLVVLCAYLSAAPNVRVYGDSHQIPYIVTVTQDFKQRTLSDYYKPIDTLCESWRCPVDIAAIWGKLYDESIAAHGIKKKFVSRSKVRRSIQKVIFTDMKVQVESGAVILCMYQDEFQQLQTMYPTHHVSTVNGFQGKEAKVVYIIRKKKESTAHLYLESNKAYTLVATTRHTHKLTYVTPKSIATDYLQKVMQTQITEDELNARDPVKCGWKEDEVKFQPAQPLLSGVKVATDMHRQLTVGRGKMIDAETIAEAKQVIEEMPTTHVPYCMRNDTKLDTSQLFTIIARKFKSLRTPRGTAFIDQNTNEMMNINGIAEGLHDIEIEREELESTLPHYEKIEYTANINTNGLQFFHDMIYHSSYQQQDTDWFQVDRNDIEFELPPGFVLPLWNAHAPLQIYDKMVPVISTGMSAPRMHTTREATIAIIKRNMQASPDMTLNSTMITCDGIFEILERNVFVPNWRNMIRLQNDVGAHVIVEWIYESKKVVDTNTIIPSVCVMSLAVSVYNLIIKRTPKPVVDINEVMTYAALQTVVYSDKEINAIFSPIFRQMKKMLMRIMKKNHRILTDMSAEDFAVQLSEDYPPHVLRQFKHRTELDISKYDKSQGLLALEIDCRFMRLMGVSEEYIRLWYISHFITKINDRNTGIKFSVCFQRKSGDASTFIGNTFFLISVVNYCMNLGDSVALYAGDDSLIFSDLRLSPIQLCEARNVFNLEMKNYNFNFSYFCSRYLVELTDDIWAFVADPLKLLIRLGRFDLINPEHAKEYQISLIDTTKDFDDLNLLIKVSDAVTERYNIPFDIVEMMATMRHLIRNEFDSLFVIPKGAKFNYPSIKPLIDD